MFHGFSIIFHGFLHWWCIFHGFSMVFPTRLAILLAAHRRRWWRWHIQDLHLVIHRHQMLQKHFKGFLTGLILTNTCMRLLYIYILHIYIYITYIYNYIYTYGDGSSDLWIYHTWGHKHPLTSYDFGYQNICGAPVMPTGHIGRRGRGRLSFCLPDEGAKGLNPKDRSQTSMGKCSDEFNRIQCARSFWNDSGYIFFMGCFSMGIWWRCDGYTPDHPMGARRSQAKPRALALPFGGMATRSTCHVIFFWRRLKLECGCNHFSEWRIRRFSWLQVLLTTWICESTLLLQLWLLLSSCCIWIPHKSTCSEAGREENHWKPLVKNPSERGLANVLWINLIKLSDS